MHNSRPYCYRLTLQFEMLTKLQKDQRLVQIESLPRLKLSPPAVYHEKVSRVSGFTPGESSGKDTKPSQSGLMSKKMKAKGSIFRPRLGKSFAFVDQ